MFIKIIQLLEKRPSSIMYVIFHNFYSEKSLIMYFCCKMCDHSFSAEALKYRFTSKVQSKCNETENPVQQETNIDMCNRRPLLNALLFQSHLVHPYAFS